MARTRTTRGGPGHAGAQPVASRGGTETILKFRNRTLTVFRGTAANAYGDLSDVGAVYLQHVQAALAETTDTVFDAATQRQQIIRSVTCVVPAWAGIVDTDTLQDEFTGFFYMITSLEVRPSIGYYPAPTILTLRMRSGVSISSD